MLSTTYNKVSKYVIGDCLYLPASKVATAIGQNKYNSREELIKEIIQGSNYISEEERIISSLPPKLQEKIKEDDININYQVFDEKEKEDIQKNPLMLDEILEQKEIPEEVKKDILETKNIEKELINKEEHVLLNKYIISNINKKDGIKNEKTAISIFEEQTSFKVKENNSKCYYTYLVDEYGDKLLTICGKIDGLYDNEKLIEFKNRQRFFFIPIYDLIQCHLYMKMLNKDRITLVQKLKDEIKIDEIALENDLIKEMEKELLIFCNEIYTSRI